jgi:excisionase family DNA binding protein
MNVRAAGTPRSPDTPRQSVRVARVAELLDCTEGEVRGLIDRGEIEAHGFGIRGVRVFLDSVAEYQALRARAPKDEKGPKAPRVRTKKAVQTPSLRAALADARALGIIPK